MEVEVEVEVKVNKDDLEDREPNGADNNSESKDRGR